jgi:hypothetical protein
VTVEGSSADGSLDEAMCCERHQRKFVEHQDRMQADASRMKDLGFAKSDLERIVLARVDRGAYEAEPYAVENVVRAIEEQLVSVKLRFAVAFGSKRSVYIDVSSDAQHFIIERRRDGSFGLSAFGASAGWRDLEFRTLAALIDRLAKLMQGSAKASS